MTLRSKMLLVFFLAFAVISAATYVVSYLVITRNFERLEERIVAANATRIANVVGHQLDHLDATSHDYATWDSTYKFMGHKYRDYTEVEISRETFNLYGIDAFLLFDTKGRLALCQDFANGKSVCGKRTAEMIATGTEQARAQGEGSKGLLVLSGGPMLVSMKPILRTDGSGPSRGTLVMGRWVDQKEIQNFAKILQLPMTAVVGSASDIHTSVANTELSGRTAWMESSGESITGHARIPDMFGGPGLVLSTEFHRDLLHEGKLAQRLLLIVILLIALLLKLVAFFALQRAVLRRIGRLSSTAERVSSTGDLSLRVRPTGKDEITALEKSFNAMLSEVEESRRELLFAHKALEYHARHDPLTGVLNRAALTEGLRSELNRTRREGTQMAVMLLDLDHFKRVNDEYGHTAGDEVLRAVMDSVRHSVRQYDIVGRYGGEEFMLVAPSVGREDALTLAERVRQSVEELATTPRVTLSIGVTTATGFEDEKELLEAVDGALYRAKAQGRNRVEFYELPAQLGNGEGPITNQSQGNSSLVLM